MIALPRLVVKWDLHRSVISLHRPSGSEILISKFREREICSSLEMALVPSSSVDELTETISDAIWLSRLIWEDCLIVRQRRIREEDCKEESGNARCPKFCPQMLRDDTGRNDSGSKRLEASRLISWSAIVLEEHQEVFHEKSSVLGVKLTWLPQWHLRSRISRRYLGDLMSSRISRRSLSARELEINECLVTVLEAAIAPGRRKPSIVNFRWS